MQLWNERGLVLYFLGRYQEAVDTFQHSLAVDPQFVDTYVFSATPTRPSTSPKRPWKRT